jgi:hypothetical protein
MFGKKTANLIRPFLIVSALLIVTLILWNTNTFFKQFKIEEQQKMSIWATAQSQFLAADPNVPLGELVLKIFQSNTQTPMLLINKDGSFNFNNYKGKEPKNNRELTLVKNQFLKDNPPIEIIEGDTVLATLYFGESTTLKKLKYYPLGLLVILILFSSVVYFVMRLDKISAQNLLWASMAKETAHQIATPLSALMAWNNLLKEQINIHDISKEIDRDLDRLSIISNRFSSIGNSPSLIETDIIAASEEGLDYLKERMSKSVNIRLQTSLAAQSVLLNKPLYFWCLENLIKNSIDAIKGKGEVLINIKNERQYVVVSIQDKGSGISKKEQKNIFKPGFSTKKSGWGLGLSLSKRIVEQYHNGHIKLGYSHEKGTEIQMYLPFLKEPKK